MRTALARPIERGLLAAPKRIDAERKRMRDTLDALADDVRRPLTEWEQAEDDRVRRHKDALEGITTLVVNCGETSDSLRSAIGAVDSIAIGPEWEEFEAEADRRELELKLQAEQAEKAAAQAKADKIAAEQRAEQDRIAGIEREKQAAEAARQAEIKRQADAKAAEEAEAARRERDKAHKGKVNRAALAAFVQGGMTEECAKLAVTLIAKGEIPAIKISY